MKFSKEQKFPLQGLNIECPQTLGSLTFIPLTIKESRNEQNVLAFQSTQFNFPIGIAKISKTTRLYGFMPHGFKFWDNANEKEMSNFKTIIKSDDKGMQIHELLVQKKYNKREALHKVFTSKFVFRIIIKVWFFGT